MNPQKWRMINIPMDTLENIIASHIYAMRGMDKREIVELQLPDVLHNIQVKIRLKEVNQKTSLMKQIDAKVAE